MDSTRPDDPDIWPPPVLPDYVLPFRDWKATYAAEKLRREQEEVTA